MRKTATNILLAEDNAADIVLIKKCLKEATSFSFELHVVKDGEAVLNFLAQKGDYLGKPSPDLIILDLNMPKLSGIEVLQQIKADDRLKVTPIIILTSSDSRDDIVSAYKNHANCYIQKPRDLEGLMQVCKRIDDFWLELVEFPASKGD